MNYVRGDDDVLALLDEMGGGGGGIVDGARIDGSSNGCHRRLDAPLDASVTADRSSTSSPSISPPISLGVGGGNVDPLIEISRRRCHEKFKAGFHDLFRACCHVSSTARVTTVEDTTKAKKTTKTTKTTDGDRDVAIRSIISSTWPSIPPHTVWERYQFGLKALEADCVRGAEEVVVRRVPATTTLMTSTARVTLARIVEGRRMKGTPVWEPLLPVPSIFDDEDYDYDDDGGTRRRMTNGRYRESSLALLRGEVEFQFRRTFKCRKSRGISEIRGLRALLENGDGDEGGRILATAIDENYVDDEEYVLRTIFRSRPFANITQKLHRKFLILAGEWHSAFLTELRKLSNRSIVEEEQRGGSGNGGGKKRKRGRNGGGTDRGVPKIASADYRDDDDPICGGGRGRGGGRDDGGQQLTVTFAGISLRINATHEAKLRSMYRRALGNGNNRHGEHERDDAVVDELLRREFPRLLFSLLLRYDALEGAGLQSAVPDAVFRYLRTRFGLGVFECFASPLNCYWSKRRGSSDDDDDTGSGEGAVVWGGGRYGSAFIDTDAPFGSAGSFFDLDFSKGGVYQANPPFASEFIEKMYSRMHHSLATTEIPLMFVVFVPSWSESPGYRMIETSLHVTRHVLLSQKNDVHYYTEGTQHRRRSSNDDGGGHRTASFDTSVFFLQNDAARERWPLRDDDGIILKSAFSMNPIDSEGIREGGKDGIRGKKISRDRTVKTPSVVSRRRDGSGNAASLSAKRGRRETKKAKSERKSNVSLMKTKKLMTGGQDELSILASMGILDGEQHQR